MTDERMPWFPCYASKLLGALAGMGTDEGYVYWIICLRIYETGKPCRDSLEALARRTGMVKRRVENAMRKSFEVGRLVVSAEGITNPFAEKVMAKSEAIIKKRKIAGEKGALKRWEKPEQDQQNPDGKRIANGKQTDAHLHRHRQSKSSETPKGVSSDPPKRRDDWPDDFLDRFWLQYPPGRKTGKKAVAAKLARIRQSGEVTFATLMLGVARYAASNPNPQYTKAPEVWLNKGCWDDEHVKGRLFDEANRSGDSKLGFSGIAARIRRQLEAEAGPAPDDAEPINGR